MRDRPLHEVLDAVAARTPAPGGGSTAAWTCALASGLVEMAASFAGDELAAAGRRAAELRARALELAEAELHAFEPVLAAMRLPRDDPERAERVRAASSRAADSPMAIARAAAEVAELGSAAVREGNPNLRGDAIAGVLLAEAACAAASALVRINLGAEVDDQRRYEAYELGRRALTAREEALRSG